ncbi:DUF262 domain-containing protein [Leptolyngbya ohadii]|uniref:DUF262 domain-containing protein n=1 Tax=Leptolyngbya ohadii TaxID=1962290 RepID=UPI000B59B1A1|nr:DUF262 domain-containing protein [Leptolyngbya ohadii]
MSNQIKPSVTNPTIADIYQYIESGRLVLKPDFQRRFVWTHDHQEDFIDTILKGYPFPEIYVCQGDIDTKKLRTTQFVIDGQQRLTTIKKYIDGEHDDKPLSKVLKFEDLTEDQRRDFLSYQIVVRDIGKVEDETIREIFRRINLTKFQLDDIEVHNAVYNGYFIKTAKEILEDISLRDYGVFYDSEFTRMADLHFILLVMSTLENKGYFPRDNDIETYIAANNDFYPNRDHMKAQLVKTFAVIKDLNLPLDSIWFRKSNFFTLVVELSNNINKIPKDIVSRLMELEARILENKNNAKTEFGVYYSYMYQATNNRKARVVRGETFNKYIFSGVSTQANDSSSADI